MAHNRTASPGRPMLLFVLTGLLLCFALVQGYYYIVLPYAIPGSFEIDAETWLSIAGGFLACLYLALACILLLRGRRSGVYLVELAVLYSLVSSVWLTLRTWYHIEEFSLMPEPVGWLVHIAFFIAMIAGHLLFLWCLRNEKAILYFDLKNHTDHGGEP